MSAQRIGPQRTAGGATPPGSRGGSGGGDRGSTLPSGTAHGPLSDHPEWLTLLIAAASWCWLLWLLAAPVSLHHDHDGAASSAAVLSYPDHLLIWVAMGPAMMLPTTVPHVRYVGFGTRATRTQRSILLFALGYLTIWLLPGLLLAAFALPASAGVVAVAALLAGAWELTPAKRRALLRCCRTWPVRYAGTAADASAIEYGVRHALGCLVISGPAMVVLMLAGHPWWATVALALVMAAQKLLTKPQRWRGLVTVGWLGASLAAAAVAALG